MGEMHGVQVVAEVGETRVRMYPLNSRRLTARVVNRIACSLGLPKSSLADARQMIEGQLAETRESQNVQVDVDAGMPEEMAVIRLRDEDGVFLEIDTPDERELSTSEGESPGKASEPETLDETETERQLEEQDASTGDTRMPTSANLRELEDTAGVCLLSVDPDGGGGGEHTRIRKLERNLLEASERATRLETQMEFLMAHTVEL